MSFNLYKKLAFAFTLIGALMAFDLFAQCTATGNQTVTSSTFGGMGLSGGSFTQTYTYDANGRIVTVGGETYNFDASGRLTSITSTGNPPITITNWDANGYPTAATQTNSSTTTNLTFEFNNIGQLIRQVLSASDGTVSQTITFMYNYNSNGELTSGTAEINRVGGTNPGMATFDLNYSGTLCRGIVLGTAPGSAAPIPTLSQWRLLIFGLLVLNLGLGFIYRKEMV